MARSPRKRAPATKACPHPSPESRWVDGLTAAVDEAQPSQQALESLIVRLANRAGIGMHGRYLEDRLACETPPTRVQDDPKGQRQHYQLSPYNLPSANAVVTAVWRSPESGEPFVLLGRRWAEWRQPQSGIGRVCVLPGGFMDPAPRDGAPGDIAHDRNLDESAARELQEETGLTAPAGRLRQIQTRSDYYDIAEGRTHMIYADYLADFSGTRRPPRAVGDDDLAAARWIPLSEIHFRPGTAPAPDDWQTSRYHVHIDGQDCMLYDAHGQALEATIRAWRDDELRASTGLDGVAVEAAARRLEAGSHRRPYSLLRRRPESEVGPEAERWHREASRLATRLTNAVDARAGRLAQEVNGEIAAPNQRRAAPIWQPPLPGLSR